MADSWGNYGGFGGFGTSSGPGYGSFPSQSSGSSSGSGSSSSSSSTQMIPGMVGIYNQLLGLNQGNYGNILAAYGQGQQQAANQLPGIYGGYNTLGADVQNTLGMGQVLGQNGNWGVADPAAKAIARTYADQVGKTTQQMSNAGLGNTTIGGNLQNQNARAASDSYGALGAQLADKAAGYQSQIGQAGLNARMQGLGMQTGLSQSQGQTLGGYKYGNTAGDLTGQVSSSQSQNSQTSTNASTGGQPGGGSANTGATGGQGFPQVGSPGNGSTGATNYGSPSSPVQIGGGSPYGGGGGTQTITPSASQPNPNEYGPPSPYVPPRPLTDPTTGGPSPLQEHIPYGGAATPENPFSSNSAGGGDGSDLPQAPGTPQPSDLPSADNLQDLLKKWKADAIAPGVTTTPPPGAEPVYANSGNMWTGETKTIIGWNTNVA